MLPPKPVKVINVFVEETPPEVESDLPTEVLKQRLRNGEWVDLQDDILDLRRRVRGLCARFSATVGEGEEASKILEELLPGKDIGACVMPPFWCDWGYNIKLGYEVFLNFNTVMLDGALISIGDYTQVGPNCSFNTPNHPKDPMIRRSGVEQSKAITIGKDCWIGGNVAFCPGVSVGDNTIIGAGSVVSKDIPANCVAVGNPCKVIKWLYTDGQSTVSERVHSS
eukprot:Protomagalhaensia_wolfi_Nauph_80__1692@NODE_204_length_3192_cov_200_178243_g153_i0_p2_GENE_NODE_204_length_3192_cov_200_178243_g153_i0NODE_204_length_3192_cov_200_178243_g153_i0_p2_ORF_typecomplete_len224_score45_67Hexapep_2/PF14602_6/0_0026Hexapep_2/PF14602_6/7e11Hexapep/PF00132_24/1_8Hexapep/PF00132_24/4_7e09Mac/PF12464_8/0_0034_NODE_204_length_3192_cov_200_178243_g153_i017302401